MKGGEILTVMEAVISSDSMSSRAGSLMVRASSVIRIVNLKDLVPKVPLPPLYEHIGTEISAAWRRRPVRFCLQHGLNTYATGLTLLIGRPGSEAV
jgi:hypothetical protein